MPPLTEPLNADVLAAVCHDLRGPLGALGTWVHVLSSGKARPETQAQALTAMATDVQAMGGLIEQLSILSALWSGKDPLSIESVDVVPLLQSARQGAVQGGDLLVSVEAGEPSISLPADRVRLTQLVSLFASLGLTGRYGIRTLSARRGSGRVVIAVGLGGITPRPLAVALAQALCFTLGGTLVTVTEQGREGLTAQFPTSS